MHHEFAVFPEAKPRVKTGELPKPYFEMVGQAFSWNNKLLRVALSGTQFITRELLSLHSVIGPLPWSQSTLYRPPFHRVNPLWSHSTLYRPPTKESIYSPESNLMDSVFLRERATTHSRVHVP